MHAFFKWFRVQRHNFGSSDEMHKSELAPESLALPRSGWTDALTAVLQSIPRRLRYRPMERRPWS